MYSTFAATADADSFDDNTFGFGQAKDDVLSIPMSHESAHTHLKVPAPDMIPITGLNRMVYGPYNESTTSSSQYGYTRDGSEGNDSHLSGREDRDGSISSGYVNGQDRSYAPSPLHISHTAHPTFQIPSNLPGNSYGAHISNDNRSPLHPAKTTTISPTTVLPTSNKEHAIPPNPASEVQPSLKESSMVSPTDQGAHSHTPPTARQSTKPASMRKAPEFRANSSIPAEMSWPEFARQGILGAESSRLNPFALHPEEYKLLRNHVTHAQVTIYLNIRNAILRLWTRNPLVAVTPEEAAGCARDKRYFGLALVAYNWLLRNGYINFGCVEVPNTAGPNPRSKAKAGSQKTVLVIGAGMAGLGCARHVEGLFSQLGDRWADEGELPPKVIVLEARRRIGGRVYSHPLRNQQNSTLPRGHRCTAEMGAQIVTGFERGNPMNALIRGQLGIPYHALRDNTILYDHDGTIVERSQDLLVEKLYNDVLERVSVYRNKPATFRTVEGDRNMILFGREPSDTGGPTVAELEQSSAPLPAHANTTASTTEEKPSSGVEKLAGRAYQLTAGFDADIPAAEAVRRMGWTLKPEASSSQTLELDTIARSVKHPTLGPTMDEGIRQYQDLINLSPKDLRLLNWHHANLEYANAVSVNQLSLSGWDQDIGNEFEGEHTQIIGGYQQVPRGLWHCPTKLDVRFNSAVKSIHYNMRESVVGKAVKVACHNGEVFEADEVVLTTPLGVLKSGAISFNPPLPSWKNEVIERMGFGLLNKVILVYEEAFWEPHRDMFGLLNEAERQDSLDTKDYASRRGRFYLFWNCIKTSGRPTLVALMAGDAAHYAEASTDEHLVQEVTSRLTKMFSPKPVPLPSETIVTRWSKDPYARGSYSYVGPTTLAGDYDVMAKPHGLLHFAGEATCGTHPATVHGAYLSGLRAAAEVVESMIGPIEVPTPLVEKVEKKPIKTDRSSTPITLAAKHKLDSTDSTPPSSSQDGGRNAARKPGRDEAYEASIIGAILNEIGERPIKPGRSTGVNPFLLFTKDNWYACKEECDQKRQAATGDPNAKASKTEIRSAIGLKWRTASEEVKKPYLEQTSMAKEDAAAMAKQFKESVERWDREAERIRKEFVEKNPPPDGDVALYEGRTAIEVGGGKRLRRG
ncbi:uncharacterized protein EI97DRAFT_414363 [Westerdykella ornata]|uniref:SWIRM domain-containing protein n=1 Tax=Westerdykella ornata TaxID=318751 RepID=A0A6A6JP00_WESOR|nr:uncharacterized protein EI97DRAFT_414363 [Westerdykella ornata]KAF2278117.1 hypothetical protein EI97DRAFT_414363 [Westerdykella ornata]